MDEASLLSIRKSIQAFRDIGLTFAEIAGRTGVSKSSLSALMRNEGHPSKTTLAKLLAYDWQLPMHEANHEEADDTHRSVINPPVDLFISAAVDQHESSDYVEKPDHVVKATNRASDTSSDDRDLLTHEFYIPVVGFAWFSERERRIIDHPAFQRLATLNQLGLAYTVFRGATHRRFEHVLGTVQITERMIEAVTKNHRRALAKEGRTTLAVPIDDYELACPPTDFERRFIRLAALLHDIGHLPFGHSIEDELHLLNKHDKDARLRKIMNRDTWAGVKVRPLFEVIDEEYEHDWSALKLDNVKSHEIVTSLILRAPTKILGERLVKQLTTSSNPAPKQEEVNEAFMKRCGEAGIRLAVCGDIVGNTICADLLDYLHRDWFHVGKPRYMEDRVLQYMEIRGTRKEQAIEQESGPFRWNDKFVINVGRNPRFRTDGISAILDLLESRYHLSEAVLFHRTKLKATAMLERCLILAFGSLTQPETPHSQWESAEKGWNTAVEDFLLELPEESLLPQLATDGDLPGAGALEKKDKAVRDTRFDIARRLRIRQYYQPLLTVSYDQAPRNVIHRVQDLYADNSSGADTALNRELALRRAEADFKLQTGDLAVYCPERRMNDKIARVQILAEGQIQPLEQYERENEDALTGGHLTAQLARFKRLWRISFFYHPRVTERLKDAGADDAEVEDWLDALRDYLRVMMLRILPPGSADYKRGEDELLAEARRIAARLATLRGFTRMWGMTKPVKLSKQVERSAARSSRTSTQGDFPSGLPSIWCWLESGENDTE